MHRTTVILGGLCLVLALTTGAVTWKLFHIEPAASPKPLVGGASVDLGLPGITHETDRTRIFAAKSAILFDEEKQAILFEQNAFERRPIASITKLMTAMIALDHGIPWDKPAAIQQEEYVQGGRLLLHPGETVTMRDLFAASLLGSANNATLAYVREMGIPKDEFVREMNRKAIELGLEQTQFADVTGLDPKNISTAYEVARMAHIAFSQYPDIADVTSRSEYPMIFGGSGREHAIKNTNKLVSENGYDISGSKTGFLYEALYCLVVRGESPFSNRISVILGSETEHNSLIETKKLLEMDIP